MGERVGGRFLVAILRDHSVGESVSRSLHRVSSARVLLSYSLAWINNRCFEQQLDAHVGRILGHNAGSYILG